jgi:formylglycine-generating enzyme required for sulfatase activity
VAGPALERRARAVWEIENASAVAPPSAEDVLSQVDCPSVRPLRQLRTLPLPAPQLPATHGQPVYSEPSSSLMPHGMPTSPGAPSPPRRAGWLPIVLGASGGLLVFAAVAVAWLLGGGRRVAVSPPPAPSGAAPQSAQASASPVTVRGPACPHGMVLVSGGKFFMGADDGVALERPAHKVVLGPYCIDVHEVTTAQYKACSDVGECKRAGVTNDWDGMTRHDRDAFDPLCNMRDPVERAQHPINCVDWTMADEYCRVRGARLPTEAEWEVAAPGPGRSHTNG